MTAIDLEHAKISVDRIFQSALDGNDVIITDHEKPVLKLTRIESSRSDENQTNALEKLKEIRISASYDFSTNADLYPMNGTDE